MSRLTYINSDSKSGFILLEVVIAMMVFAIAAVGLTRALSSMLETTNFLQREQAVQLGLEAIINEARAHEDEDLMELERVEEYMGVTYNTKVERVRDLTAEDGKRLYDLHLLIATATYHDGSEDPLVVQMYVYVED